MDIKWVKRAREIADNFAKKQAEKRKQKRLSDLFAKIHVFSNDVQVNIPNVYAIAEIERLYGSLEEIDFNNPKQLAEILVILEHQRDPQFDFLSQQERDKLRVKKMQDISAAQIQDYVLAIHEVFYGLKKNEIQKQRTILEQAMALLDGEKSLSTSASKPGSN